MKQTFMNLREVKKDSAGYTLIGKEEVVYGEYEELMTNQDLRIKFVEELYEYNNTVLTKIRHKNAKIDYELQVRPCIQIEKSSSNVYSVYCCIGSEQYVGTNITYDNIIKSPYIALRLIDILYEDHKHTKQNFELVNQIEERAIL